MARASLVLGLVLPALLATAARADVPVGTLALRGTERGASGPARDVEGTLTITRGPGGVRVTRSVRSRDGSTHSFSGVARVTSDSLAVALAETRGITSALASIDGASAGRILLRAVYRLARDGSLHGQLTGGSDATAWTGEEVASAARSKDEYFALLDEEDAFQSLARKNSLEALLELLGRTDVPASVDRAYTKKAGSPGGGRVLLALDYTRGMNDTPPWREALKGGLKHVVATEILTPRLSHFRGGSDGKTMFAGDVGFVAPFRDSGLTSPESDQVGHLLCAVETGQRAGYYASRRVKRSIYELGLRMGGGVVGVRGVEPTIADWSRAGIIGHEMIGDDDGTGFLGQMKTYGRLVANGDPEGVRAAWDDAVASVLAGDHVAAWKEIRRIAKAAEIPETTAEVEANRANPNPRFAAPGADRKGNSVEDLALSIYGFALGYRSATDGYATPAAARADFEAFLSAQGSQAAAIDEAARVTR